MEDAYHSTPQPTAAGPERSGFLARWRNKRARRNEVGVEQNSASEVPRRFGARIGHLLWRRGPERTGRESYSEATESIDRGIGDKAAETRRFGSRVLNLVDAVRARVSGEAPSRTRSQEESILTDARSDMKEALDDLSVAVGGQRESAGPARKEKFASERAEQKPASAGMAEFALAIVGGGLLLTAWESHRHKSEHRKLKSERRENAKLFRQQDSDLKENSEQLDQLRREMREHAEMSYVKRVGEFVHTQADVTREVTREVREYQGRVPAEAELYPLPSERGSKERGRQHAINPERSPEPKNSQFDRGANTTLGGAATPLSERYATMLQKLKIKPKITATRPLKQPPTKVTGAYAVVFITFVIILVIWLILGAVK